MAYVVDRYLVGDSPVRNCCLTPSPVGPDDSYGSIALVSLLQDPVVPHIQS